MSRVVLNKDEQLKFATALYEIREGNPDLSWTECFAGARKVLPADRQIGATKSHPSEMPWLNSIWKDLQKQEKKGVVKSPKEAAKSAQRQKLNEEEKVDFGKKIFEAKKANPKGGWAQAIRLVNKTLPPEKQLGAHTDSPHQIKWILPTLEKLEAQEKARPIIVDQRGTLPKVSTPEAPKAETGITIVPEGEKGKRKYASRVHLTQEEKMLFAENVYAMHTANPGIGWAQCMAEANNVLPPHRRLGTTFRSIAQMPWLSPMLTEVAKRPAPAPIPEPEVVAAPTPAAPAAPDIDDASANALASLLLQNLPALMKSQKFQNAFANGLGSSVSQATKVDEKKPERKRKVLVIGLLPLQANEVQKEFSHLFDLRFLGPNMPSQQIKDTAKNADMAILMTKFVSHSTQAAIRQHPGFTYCNGNHTALRQLLSEKV